MNAAHPGGFATLEPDPSRWTGSLELQLARRGDATRVIRRRHRGPLLIQRPFYPEGPRRCHIYLLHPPGGLVGGDRLEARYQLDGACHGLITTPSAGKAYRVDRRGREQGQHSRLEVGSGAVLEWLPQESIAFNGARLHSRTTFHLQPGATLLGWDLLCLGRPASGEIFSAGRVRQQLEIWAGPRPLLLERADYRGDGAIMHAPWGLRGQAVVGSLFACWPEANAAVTSREEALQRTRDLLDASGYPGLAAATLVNGVLLVRGLGACTESLRVLFEALWRALRPLLAGCEPCPPRIWNT